MTTLASGFDGAVRGSRRRTSRAAPSTVTQYDNATVGSGTATDEEYAYDDWGNRASFTQFVDSVVGGGGRGDFGISYPYAKATPTNGRVYLRHTGASYPGNRDLPHSCPTASNFAGFARHSSTRPICDLTAARPPKELRLGRSCRTPGGV